jgi:heme o synthase
MEAGARARAVEAYGRRAYASWWLTVRLFAGDYVALTKPRVISLLLVTTVATMFVADPSPGFGVILATLIGGYLAAGGAGAINHYLERDIDSRMSRTSRRPLPSGRVEPRAALWFGIALGAASFALFALAVNMTAALLALAGLLGYVFVYTMWLKPRTSQNIVLGGAAGAVPPLVGWAAAAGGLEPSAFYLFAIVFYWTPPHFWALALLIKDDYARTGVPMLPVTDGEPETRRQILLYGWLLTAITALPLAVGLLGALYGVSALFLNALFVALCLRLYRRADRRSAALLFHYSLAYLALLFVSMALDRVVA